MEKPDSSSKFVSEISTVPNDWDNLGCDLTELILCRLPIPSLILASSVCKNWNSIINSTSFRTVLSHSKNRPWLFIFAHIKDSTIKNQVFGFDPESNDWIKLPRTTCLFHDDWTIGSNGFLIDPHRREFSLFSASRGLRCLSSPVRFYSFNLLIGSVRNPPAGEDQIRFIVAGRAKAKDGKFHEYDCTTVEIYNPHQDSWETCPRLPEIFRPNLSPPPFLSSAMLRDTFYVYGIYSGFLISFDMEKRIWSDVRTLRPPGVLFSYLMSCQGHLVLAGLCCMNKELQFYVWRVDQRTLEFSELSVMPRGLLSCLLRDDDDDKTVNGSLTCVGTGNMVYVLSRIHNGVYYTVCMCEISKDLRECRWTRVSDFYLPEPLDKVHKVISLCANASLQDFLGGNATHSQID